MTAIYLTEYNCKRYAATFENTVVLEYKSLKISTIMRRMYYV